MNLRSVFMIIDLQCDNCNKQTTCKWFDLLDKFNPDKRNPVGVDLEFKNCQEYDEVKI